METSSTTISVRRAVRRAEMDEYPLQLDDYNFNDALHHITSLRADYQEFELQTGGQCAQYDSLEQPSDKSLSSTEPWTFEPASSYHMHKDWTGNWKVRLNSPSSANELLFRVRPDHSAQSDSQDYRWVTDAGNLVARSGWDDGTPNICLEPELTLATLDLLMACYVIKL